GDGEGGGVRVSDEKCSLLYPGLNCVGHLGSPTGFHLGSLYRNELVAYGLGPHVEPQRPAGVSRALRQDDVGKSHDALPRIRDRTNLIAHPLEIFVFDLSDGTYQQLIL